MATGSTSVDVFRDLVNNTNSTVFTGPDQIINDATLHRNYFTRFEHSGGDRSKMMQAGPNIVETIFLSGVQRATFYSPDADSFSYQRDDVLSNWLIPWRFLFTHKTWTDHEIVLNTGGLSGGALKDKLKSIDKGKDMAVITDLVDTLESTAWAPPSATQMEAVTGKKPNSILCFVTELSSGLPPGYATAGTTTVQNIAPGTYSNWKNQRASYTDLPKVGTDLFRAMSQGMRQSEWHQMPYRPDLSTGPDLNGFCWFTDNEGVMNYEDSLRLSQDEFKNGSSGQDPHYGMPTFRGAPVKYVSALDGASVWPTGSGGALSTSADTTNSNAGPRYVGLTAEHIKCVWHSGMYMRKKPSFNPDDQPHVNVQTLDTWLNRVCTSRRRQCIVYPSANLS